jgi:hypothetical protein
MLINIKTDIVLEVKDEDEAESACHALGMLGSVLTSNSFPHDVVDTEVDHYEKVSKKEAHEKGWVE